MEEQRRDTFDHAVARTRNWIDAIAWRLGGRDSRAGYCALRAVLHLVRDRLPLPQSLALGARLPLLIRGIYYEGFSPHAARPKVRHLEEFLGLLQRELRSQGELELDPQRALDAVFDKLRTHLGTTEIDELLHALPAGMRLLFDETRRPTWIHVHFGDPEAGDPLA